MAGDHIVELRGLVRHYGETTAVAGLDLAIARGEIFGLLGPNGAGKTTTILMMLGLTEPSAGAVTVDGIDPTHHALEVKRRVGYLPDDVGFYDDLTGRENLEYTAQLNRIPRRDAGERIQRLLDEVGLTDAADRAVGGYSRGMRQRLGLADALVKEPTLLVLDEPTVNIDPEGVREILELVRRLRDERGVTVMLSSHLLHQVQEVCDRVGIFVNGRLAALGTPAELADQVDPGWTVELGVEAVSLEAARSAVEAVAAVTSVELDGEMLVAHAATDVRTAVAEAALAAGARLTHLARRQVDLDAVYHRFYLEATDGDRS